MHKIPVFAEKHAKAGIFIYKSHHCVNCRNRINLHSPLFIREGHSDDIQKCVYKNSMNVVELASPGTDHQIVDCHREIY